MNWLNRASSLFLVGLSLLILFSSIKLGIGNLRKPGPGFIPLLASALVLIFSLIILMMEMRRSAGVEKKTSLPWQNLIRMVSLVLGLAFYIFFLKMLGYLIAAFLLMFIMFFIFEPKRWRTHLASAGIAAALSFFTFRSLGVQLPAGLFHIGW